MHRLATLTYFLIVYKVATSSGFLYPQDSETREKLSLDGLWTFVASTSGELGREQQWYSADLNKFEGAMPMAVPSSYNDLSSDKAIRDHVGPVWYQRTFFVSQLWTERLVWLRFGSVNYEATVWVNGHEVMVHEIGHLPFQADVTELVNFGRNNLLTVMCNNELSNTTIPMGNVVTKNTDEGEKKFLEYTFDFFNYAGIHRSVHLYTTPKMFIEDIDLETNFQSEQGTNPIGLITYAIKTNTENETFAIGTKLYDLQGTFVVSEVGKTGSLKVPNASLWWPYLMDENPGYLYTLEVELLDETGDLVDVFRQKVGIRKVQWSNGTLTMNGKQLYLMGFGRHEDHELRGRGFDWASVVKDYDSILWTGANAYRTSHYPYAEEIMDLADSLGIMIIDECPAVNIDNVNEQLRRNHMQSISELIQRDKNRPSVIAWSIANEPRSQKNRTVPYWRAIANHAKSLDKTRPITASLNRNFDEDNLAQFLDVISFNRYNSWYRNEGHLDMITQNVVEEARNWHEKFARPVLMSEYGADTLEGLHFSPSYIWSEEYQVEVLSNHFKAFDQLRREKWFVGEFIWNFADFKTDQKITRVGGNKKGIFTRNRQPKAAAHHLRQRYFQLARQIYDINLGTIRHAKNLDKYVIGTGIKDEL